MPGELYEGDIPLMRATEARTPSLSVMPSGMQLEGELPSPLEMLPV